MSKVSIHVEKTLLGFVHSCTGCSKLTPEKKIHRTGMKLQKLKGIFTLFPSKMKIQ